MEELERLLRDNKCEEQNKVKSRTTKKTVTFQVCKTLLLSQHLNNQFTFKFVTTPIVSDSQIHFHLSDNNIILKYFNFFSCKETSFFTFFDNNELSDGAYTSP